MFIFIDYPLLRLEVRSSLSFFTSPLRSVSTYLYLSFSSIIYSILYFRSGTHFASYPVLNLNVCGRSRNSGNLSRDHVHNFHVNNFLFIVVRRA